MVFQNVAPESPCEVHTPCLRKEANARSLKQMRYTLFSTHRPIQTGYLPKAKAKVKASVHKAIFIQNYKKVTFC